MIHKDLLTTTLALIPPGVKVHYIASLGKYIRAMDPVKIFLDDQWDLPDRYPGDEWTCVRTVQEARALLRFYAGKVTHLSLDSDLGATDGLEGPDLTAWLAQVYFLEGNDFWPTESITIHSRNSQGRKLMELDITNPRYNPRPEILRPVGI